MISFKVTRIFFDDPAILNHMDKLTRKVFRRFGLLTRKIAQRSIRKAKFATRKPRGQPRLNFRRKTSEPGKPPYSRKGTLKKHIYAEYDTIAQSVVIGPLWFQRLTGDAPHALEWGGPSVRKIRASGKKKGRTKKVNIKARPFMKPAFEIGKKQLPAMWAGTKLSKL